MKVVQDSTELVLVKVSSHAPLERDVVAHF
jgi:hypothetical protein